MTAPHLPHTDAPPPPSSGDSGALVDWSLARDHAGFALRAVRRRPVVAAFCFLAVASLGPVALVVMPRTYRVEAVVRAERDPVVSTLAYPVLQRSFESEDPAQFAHDMILRRDNLEALCEETGLVERWLRGRAPVVRLRDAVKQLVKGRAPTRDEQIEALVERLEKRFQIEVPGTEPGAPAGAAKDRVRIAIEWPDAQTAKLLVDTAVRRFFEGRRERERTLVRDAVAVLETNAANLAREIDDKVKKVHTLELALVRGHPALSRTEHAPRGRVPEEQALARLRATLEAKKMAAAEIERFRELRAEELRGQLARERATHSESYPEVIRTRRLLERLGPPPAELEALRSEIVALEQEVERASARVDRLVDDEDPALEYERTELRLLLTQYSSLRERISAARVETEAAQAGFDHRYGFAIPPRIPKKPVGPLPLLAIPAAILGGLLFSLFAAATLDFRSGRIIERWQIERTLRLPVVGEMRG